MATEFDQSTVVWFPPEQLGKPVGEYRQWVADHEEGGRITAEFGGLVVWVDDAPDDPTDGAGHFEAYTGADEDYVPQVKGA